MKRPERTDAPEVYVCELHGEVARVPYGDFCEVCRKRAPHSEAREAAVRELVDEVREAIDALEESALDGHAGDLRAALAKLAAIEEAESDE